MVKAIVNNTVIAESSETVYIEGNHYFPPEAIKVDLSISDTTYTCAYKGNASYYSANVDGKPVKDIACRTNDLLPFGLRVYPNPTSKFEIKGRYAFDKAQVQVVSDPAICNI
ncbi:DUF427-domain-containing protein [Russula ochroleuca]|uniref:DUF427-domain-containing protein n=1 Tax=Russula ochroleuca TaxID=152965 RepID=A0A9P5MRZ8_9AGAM|nr:DUF427-domain-containing protein [Russula ochroleuca]